MPPHGGRELLWHATSLHPLLMRNIHRQKICENINMKTNIAISSIKTIKKCTVHMPHNCWQMNYVEKICIGAI